VCVSICMSMYVRKCVWVLTMVILVCIDAVQCNLRSAHVSLAAVKGNDYCYLSSVQCC